MAFPCSLVLKGILASALAIALTGAAGAQVVCYDGFGDYGAGVQVESGANGSSGTGLDGGIGWGGPYDVSDFIKSLVLIEDRTTPPGPVNFTNGEIALAGGNRALRFYDVANGAYAVQRPLGTTFSAAAGDPLWFSVLFRANNASPLINRDTFQIGFDDAADTANPRVSIGATTTSSASPAPFHFFARSTSPVGASVFHEALPIAAATTYLLVGCVVPEAASYDTVRLWVNPSTSDDPGPPSVSATLPTGLTTLSHAIIRTANLDLNDAYVIDEWHVARDYGSVVQSLRNVLRIVPPVLPGGFAELRWSAALTGVVLETSSTLEEGSWTEVTGPFSLAGTDRLHTLPSSPRGFFRLRR